MKASTAFGFAVPIMIQSMAASVVVFMAELTPDSVVPQSGGISPTGISSASGTGLFRLDLTPGNPVMTYEVTFSGVDLLSDITGIHLHFGHEPAAGFIEGAFLSNDGETSEHQSAEGPNGPHLLNIFGLPREDDDDLSVHPETNSISGRWDNFDRNFGSDGQRDPGDSVAISEGIDALLTEEVYIQVHTKAFPAPLTGELRGQLKIVPEPTVSSLLVMGISIACFRRRKTSRGTVGRG